MRVLLRSSLGLVVVVLAVFASVASLPTPPPAWSYDTAFPLEVGIGYGETPFYEEGDPLPLERGFQGGQHVNASLRAPGLEPQSAAFVGWMVDVADDSVIGERVDWDAFLDEGYEGMPADAVYVLGPRIVIEDLSLVGREAEVRVQLTLDDGRVGRAWHRGVVDWLPDDYGYPDEDAGPAGDDAGVLGDDAGAEDGEAP